MKEILRKLGRLLDQKQKNTMFLLILMMFVGAVLQTLGIGLLVEVVKIAVDPEAVKDSRTVGMVYRWVGSPDFKVFSASVMASLAIVFLVKNLFLYVQLKATYAFVYTNQFRTSERMMRNYLRRHYEFYLNADTAVVQRNITSDVNNMYALILCLLQLTSDGIMSFFVVSYCFWKNGMLMLIMAVVMLILMIIVKKVLKPIMYQAGKDNQDYYSGLFKWISQSVQGMKDVKISGKESYFVEEYRKCGKGYVDAVQKYSLYNSIPKLLMETACVATMMIYMIVQVLNGASTESLMEAISTIGAAAFVLLPAVNRINNQINSMAYFEPFFMGVADNLQDEISGEKVDFTDFEKPVEKMPVKNVIQMKDISYAYPNTEKLIFDHANLEVPVGKSVGIVGTTGAGKSTVVDIMLGLLDLKEGQVLADGKNVMENYRGWLMNVGYIPQMSFMLDASIRKNVAFGVRDDQIDEDRVWEVLKEAQLDEFIKTLPEGLDTCIGERGIRLSGGQRQRISIARALYDDPEVLILDEATSAVDNDTEAAIMESINQFQGKKTLLIIAHRLQTIEKCDMVYRVQNGKIVQER
ncbi:MAG: ABC transporter ATP-binding protein [Lachnospiraceae bacterium]|nr:ABC transporter ATP-binding protein [Lachnospiraceae bacterium]